jgi:hypothetical protein
MSRNVKLDKRYQITSPATKAPSVNKTAFILSILVAFAIDVISYAQSNSQAAANSKASQASVKIHNFGQVTEFYYRGEQPKGDEYNQLAAIAGRHGRYCSAVWRSDWYYCPAYFRRRCPSSSCCGF